MSKLRLQSQPNCALNNIFNYIIKHFIQKVIFHMCVKTTIGIRMNSETAKTCLNVTASSNIRQTTDVCGS